MFSLGTGQKHWRFFSPYERPFLYEDRAQQFFEVDAFEPDFAKHPMAILTRPWEFVLQPGDVIFVPSNAPHQVKNLDGEVTIAASMNYVDASNVVASIKELNISANIGSGASQRLMNRFQSLAFDRTMKMEQDDISYATYVWQ